MGRTLVSPVKITRFSQSQSASSDDLVATEEPLEIRIGYGPLVSRQQKRISVTMRTPGNDFELAIGFLFTEAIIPSADAVASIRYCTELNRIEDQENIVRVELKPEFDFDPSSVNRNFYMTSSCGVCGKESIDMVKSNCRVIPLTEQYELHPDILYGLPGKISSIQQIFAYTGGIHAAGLFDCHGKLIILREDVGRHNAVDKLIGSFVAGSLLSNNPLPSPPLSNYVLFLSGRASFELIQKAAVAGIPCVCAVGAPSSLAVELAESTGITLIGFLRDQRFNCYTHHGRILPHTEY